MDHHAQLEKLRSYLATTDKNTFTNDDERKEVLLAAQSLCRRLERPMETLSRVAWIEPAYTACLKIGMDMGLFSALGGDVDSVICTVDELSKRTSTDPALLERVLRMLSSMNAVLETAPGRFGATELSRALMKRSFNSAVDFRYVVSVPVFQNLPAFLKETNYHNPVDLMKGPWQYAFQTDLPFFGWLGANAEAMEMFTNHMAGYTSQRGTWEDVYPIQDRLLDGLDGNELILVDLGGGSGHDLKRFASNFVPAATKPCLVLQDLPEVIAHVKAQTSPLPGAITPIPIDLTKETPVGGARAYYMHSVLHDWPDVEVQKILKAMHRTLLQSLKGGRKPKLLLNENVLSQEGVPPRPAAIDMIMMAVFASHERSEEQWRRLLESAGYRINEVFSKVGVDEAVIEAEAVELAGQSSI